MSGHSKWSKIKRQKGIDDIKRGMLYTKLTREIILAARTGGGEPESNFKLRLAIQKARDQNMPMDNIDRAIKRGTGELGGAAPQEITLEGYGPSGSAILVQTLTDNRNRTLQDVRNTFARHGGSLGAAGCVAWLFDPRGVIAVEGDGMDPDEISLQAIDAGADDVKVEGKYVEIFTRPGDFEQVRKTLEDKKIEISSAELSMVPKTTMELDEKAAIQTLKLMEKLEELDDVQHVASNVDFNDDVVSKFQSGSYT